MEKTEFYPNIKRYITSRVSSPEDAEDLTQSVFLEFHKGNHDSESPEPYLFGIAKNLVANYYRQKGNQPEILQFNMKIADDIAFEEHASNSKARRLIDEIEAVIYDLPSKSREAVELRLINDLAPPDAAQRIGCSVDRFYERFHEGIKFIKKSFPPKVLKKKDL